MTSSSQRALRVSALAGAIFIAAGCAIPNPDDSEMEVGPAGGELAVRGASLVVPPGAVEQSALITLAVAAVGNPEDNVGAAVELGPDGLTFETPLELTLAFDRDALTDPEHPELLRIATVVDGEWEALPDSVVDPAAGTVTASISHFSRWGIIQFCRTDRSCPDHYTCRSHRCRRVAEADCTNGIDDDGDRRVDCQDPDCRYQSVCLHEICGDGIDNDRDGTVDCSDSDCASDPAACPVCCFDTIAMSCVESCCMAGGCLGNCYCSASMCSQCTPPAPEKECSDGQDNDQDGLIDCGDSDCANDPVCRPACGECMSGQDCGAGQRCTAGEECLAPCNCQMCPACAGHCVPAVGETECGDGIDNDGDGVVDCWDSDCAAAGSCTCSPAAGGCCYPICAAGETLQCLGENICGYPCTCVPAPTWYYTCGAPVCSGYTPSGGPLCSGQAAGDPCSTVGDTCDPVDQCNRLLVCATSDPTHQVGGCPISRRDAKRDIEYLDPDALRRLHDDLLDVKLATWAYRWQPEVQRLGFIIDDLPESSPSVDTERNRVDLYGYASMAVAGLQVQAQQIADLRAEIDRLKRELDTRSCQPEE